LVQIEEGRCRTCGKEFDPEHLAGSTTNPTAAGSAGDDNADE
jgi:hypothetical protein